MTDLVRRAGTVIAVLLALLSVPQLAMAAFTGTQTSGLSVGTASLVAPTGVTGTYRCLTGVLTEGLEVTVSGFTDAGPSGATYVYSIARGSTVLVTKSSTSTSQTVSTGYSTTDGRTTTYTFTIAATLKGWTGPAYTRTVSC